VVDGEAHRSVSAEGVPDDDWPVGAECVDELLEVVGVGVECVVERG
jgi:hypothetical protein